MQEGSSVAAASINNKNLFITFYLLDDDELAAERETLPEERELLLDEYELRLGDDEEEDDLLLTDEGAELRVYDEREPLDDTVLMRVLLEPEELTLLRMVVCGRELVIAALRLLVVAALRLDVDTAGLVVVAVLRLLVVVLPEVAALRLDVDTAGLVVVAVLRLLVVVLPEVAALRDEAAAERLVVTDVVAARDALTLSLMSRALVAIRDVPCAVLLCTGMSAVRLENSLSGCCTA